MILKVGDKVQISQQYHWAKGATGTIQPPTEFVRSLVADTEPWQGHRRLVKTQNGVIEYYYVVFDAPQLDADGDGPYKGGEINANSISILSI